MRDRSLNDRQMMKKQSDGKRRGIYNSFSSDSLGPSSLIKSRMLSDGPSPFFFNSCCVAFRSSINLVSISQQRLRLDGMSAQSLSQRQSSFSAFLSSDRLRIRHKHSKF